MELFKKVIKESYAIFFFSVMALFYLYDLVTVRKDMFSSFTGIQWLNYAVMTLTLVSYFYLLWTYKREERVSNSNKE